MRGAIHRQGIKQYRKHVYIELSFNQLVILMCVILLVAIEISFIFMNAIKLKVILPISIFADCHS